MSLTKNEAAYIIGFLNELDDNFSNDGCNDMYLEDTPDNCKMYLEAEKLWVGENCDDGEEGISLENALQVPYNSRSKEQKISTNNQAILNYLRKRLKEEFNLGDKDVPDTANW